MGSYIATNISPKIFFTLIQDLFPYLLFFICFQFIPALIRQTLSMWFGINLAILSWRYCSILNEWEIVLRLFRLLWLFDYTYLGITELIIVFYHFLTEVHKGIVCLCLFLYNIRCLTYLHQVCYLLTLLRYFMMENLFLYLKLLGIYAIVSA